MLRCKKHPTYRAKRKPTSDCEVCRKMWEEKGFVVDDKIAGRPVRVNHQTLEVRKGDYAEVVMIGDVHLGSPQCNLKKFFAMIDYCKDKGLYVLLMGDMLETATRFSIGSGVYEQEFPVQTQYEQMIEYLYPLKDQILGMLRGNHELRVYNATGMDISKGMAKELGVRYLGDACWNNFRVGSQNYTVYSLHGTTGARKEGTVLNAIENIAHSFDADVVAMGHAHRCISSVVLHQKRDARNKTIENVEKHLVCTGHYLNYDGGYGQRAGMQISKLGSPKFKFYASRHDIHVSW